MVSIILVTLREEETEVKKGWMKARTLSRHAESVRLGPRRDTFFSFSFVVTWAIFLPFPADKDVFNTHPVANVCSATIFSSESLKEIYIKHIIFTVTLKGYVKH